MHRVGARRALVVEVRELVELVAGQEPEVQQCRGEGGVGGARGQGDEGRERGGHLLDFALQGCVVPAGGEGGRVGGFQGHIGSSCGLWMVVYLPCFVLSRSSCAVLC